WAVRRAAARPFPPPSHGRRPATPYPASRCADCARAALALRSFALSWSGLDEFRLIEYSMESMASQQIEPETEEGPEGGGEALLPPTYSVGGMAYFGYRL